MGEYHNSRRSLNGFLDYTKPEWGHGLEGSTWKPLGILKLMREHILDGVESVTPSAELIYSVVLEHLNQMVEHYGEYGVVLFEKTCLHT